MNTKVSNTYKEWADCMRQRVYKTNNGRTSSEAPNPRPIKQRRFSLQIISTWLLYDGGLYIQMLIKNWYKISSKSMKHQSNYTEHINSHITQTKKEHLEGFIC